MPLGAGRLRSRAAASLVLSSSYFELAWTERRTRFCYPIPFTEKEAETDSSIDPLDGYDAFTLPNQTLTTRMRQKLGLDTA